MCSLPEHAARSTREREAAEQTPIYELACRATGFRPDAN